MPKIEGIVDLVKERAFALQDAIAELRQTVASDSEAMVDLMGNLKWVNEFLSVRSEICMICQDEHRKIFRKIMPDIVTEIISERDTEGKLKHPLSHRSISTGMEEEPVLVRSHLDRALDVEEEEEEEA